MGSQIVSSEFDISHPILVYLCRNNNSEAQARRFPALTAPEPEFPVIFGSKWDPLTGAWRQGGASPERLAEIPTGVSPLQKRIWKWDFYYVLHATSSFTYVSVIYGANFSFKGALSRYSVILCRFFAVENGGKETRGRGAGQREAGLCRTSFLHQFRASRSIDVGVSVSYPCKVIPLSDEDGLWDKIKKVLVKTKRQICPWKMGKIHGNQNRLAELHGSILSCLGPKIVQDSRGFQVQLRIFHYTVQCTLR